MATKQQAQPPSESLRIFSRTSSKVLPGCGFCRGGDDSGIARAGAGSKIRLVP